jgi:hypothetical protein
MSCSVVAARVTKPSILTMRPTPRHGVLSVVFGMLRDEMTRHTTFRFCLDDFRRMFTTEAVTGGLPIHIAAKILGHANLSTTQHYLAVFQDDMIRTTDPSSTVGAWCAPKPNTADPPNMNGANFTSTSTSANSNSECAAAPTARPANTNTPASDARCCASIPNSAIGSSRSSAASTNASPKPA